MIISVEVTIVIPCVNLVEVSVVVTWIETYIVVVEVSVVASVETSIKISMCVERSGLVPIEHWSLEKDTFYCWVKVFKRRSASIVNSLVSAHVVLLFHVLIKILFFW